MIRITLCVLLGLVVAPSNRAVTATVDSLRCEHRRDPLGIDLPQPRFSWILKSSRRGEVQTAYEVLAATTPEQLVEGKADLWDSGRVPSRETAGIAYGGKTPRSSQQVFWRVRVWDRDNVAAAWSPPATFTTGLLTAEDWKARWITALPEGPDKDSAAKPQSATVLARRQFSVRPGLKRALTHLCGLGHYELTVNGRKSGDELLAPGWTQYRKTCLYDTHDITAMLKPGANAVGVVLGNGMYNVPGGRYVKFTGSFGPPKLIAQIRLEYADGSAEILGTDESWRVAPGPITFSCVYGGEDFDARKVQPWDTAGFDAASWRPALTTQGPGGVLRGAAYAAPPIKAVEVFKPVAVKQLAPKVSIWDFGQNASMMPRLRAKGPAGAIVRMIPSELVKADGDIDPASTGGGNKWWQYTLAGAGSESWFPKFYYHGARYLRVERSNPAGGPLPEIESLESVVVHSTADPVGEFACSNELFNRTRTLIRWAQRSNLMSVITDCPHREKLGWLEQYHLHGAALRYEWDLATLYPKTFQDMADSQLQSGLVPDIAPEYVVFDGGFRDSPEWGSAAVIAPWQHYLWTGDTRPIRQSYDVMAKYVAYLDKSSKSDLLDHGLGDWYDIGPKPPGPSQLTPRALTATATWLQDLQILEQAARLLGRTEDAARFAQRRSAVAASFNRSLFDKANGRYAQGSQTAQAMPLVVGLVEPADRDRVVAALVQSVRDAGTAPTAGDVGYHYLVRALADAGHSDLLFAMNNQDARPGYGYQLKLGKTSLTEAWDGGSSQNHFMLGHIMEWFYHDLAGIQPDPASPAFRHIIIKPAMVGDLKWARARYDSIRGRIESRWRRDGDTLRLEVVIPANATATVYVPAGDPDRVTESGKPAAQSPGVKFLRFTAGVALYEVGSGDYAFAATQPGPLR